MSTIKTRTRRLTSSGTRELNDTSNSDQENVCTSLKRKSSSIKSILEEARRATIQNPSRPFTPRDDNRKLFVENEYANRPHSAYSIDSIHFDAKLVPLYNKPMSARSNRLLAMIDDAKQINGTSPGRELELSERTTGVGDLFNHNNTHHLDGSDRIWDQISCYLGALSMNNQNGNVENLLQSANSIFALLDDWMLQSSPNKLSNTTTIGSSGSIGKYESRRRLILQSVSKLMDHSQAELVFKLCSIILKLQPEGLFLLSTTKLLYKLSKSECNDCFFNTEKVLTLLVDLLILNIQQSIKLSNEILIYTVATLKNVTSASSENQEVLIRGKILYLFSSMLRQSIEQSKHSSNSSESILDVDKQGQILVQIMGTLRNLANSAYVFQLIAQEDIIHSLLKLIPLMKKHTEVIHNSFRFLSKISLDKSCRENIVSLGENGILSMVKLLSRYKTHLPIIIRIVFVLGNISYSHPESRRIMGRKEFVVQLMDLLNVHARTFILQTLNEKNDSVVAPHRSISPNSPSETTDLLLKLTRLIANIALAQAELISQHQQVVLFVDILEMLDAKKNEELLLNIVRCLTNLSYFSFHSLEPNSILIGHMSRIATSIASLLTHEQQDVVYETVRCFGNISQNDSVKDWMIDHSIDNMIIQLLGHNDIDIVLSCCGVLINLSNQYQYFQRVKLRLNAQSISSKLMQIIEDSDLELMEILLQLMHNLILFDIEEPLLFSSKQIRELRMTLPELLDHLSAHNEVQDTIKERETREESTPPITTVASKLLELVLQR